MATLTDQLSAAPAPAELPRPRTLLVGTAFATAATVMVFIGMFAVYFSERAAVMKAAAPAARHTTWIKTGTIELPPGSMMMATMAMSAVTMALAVYAIRRDDRPRAYLGLGLTALFGVAVINQTIFYYRSMGITVTGNKASLQALLIFTITGAHLVMVAAGVLFLGLMSFRALAGQYSSRQSDGVVAASIFWYATVAVYTIIYFGIYVAK
jgi:heme/copper-type cytochrome/quinol oxidase subunit 3